MRDMPGVEDPAGVAGGPPGLEGGVAGEACPAFSCLVAGCRLPTARIANRRLQVASALKPPHLLKQ
jgi:hypothetical protein